MGLKESTHPRIALPDEVHLFRQTYEKETAIESVQVFRLSIHYDDFGGWFKEVMRADEEGRHLALKERGIEFITRQSNISYLAPGTKRFWHIHPEQNEVWNTSGTILLGLIDFRTDSLTYGQKMKIILSPDRAIYIPAGVAHGFINPSEQEVILNYHTDHHFSAGENTQEYRIDPENMPFDWVLSELM